MSTEKTHKKDDKVTCHITSWTIGKTPNTGTKYVRVFFTGRISWTGWITPKNEANLMATLEDLGFKGSSLKMLSNDNALDTETAYTATIEDSTVSKKNGKTYYTARWINKPWDAGFKKDDDVDLDDFDIDTSGYIEDSKDTDPPANVEFNNDEYDIKTDANFASDSIPF